MQSISIENILKVLRKDKHKAYRMIYDQYFERLYTIGLRYITDKQIVEEVVQDVFLKIFEHIEKARFEHDAAFFLWIKKIMINECLMHLRKQSIVYEKIEELYHEPNEDNSIYGQFSSQAILEAIHALPNGYRLVFNLYEIEHWSHSEIAAFLNISIATSKSQLFKAKKHLQNTLKDIYHESKQ